MSTEKTKNEVDYHKKVAEKSKLSLTPFRSVVIDRYKASKNWKIFEKELIFKSIRDYANSFPEPISVADFGCGDGSNSCQIAKIIENSIVYGFDLSPELIEVAKQRAEINGVSDRTEFFIANAEKKNPLQGRKVDVMLCLNILHHVELESVIPNLLQATKPNGMIIFQEPIAFSNNLQKLRDFLPVKKDVSPDERQLVKSEIDYLLRVVSPSTVYYNHLFSRLTRFLPNLNKIDQGHPFTKACVQLLAWTDRLIVGWFPYLNQFCGHVLIVGRKLPDGKQ